MIIEQTTRIIFQYPQDYLQEYEWCKTKGDDWIHVGTDTQCAIYENKISYSIGQPKDEQRGCDTCEYGKYGNTSNEEKCDDCSFGTTYNYEPIKSGKE